MIFTLMPCFLASKAVTMPSQKSRVRFGVTHTCHEICVVACASGVPMAHAKPAAIRSAKQTIETLFDSLSFVIGSC